MFPKWFVELIGYAFILCFLLTGVFWLTGSVHFKVTYSKDGVITKYEW
jgi:hypothetical protein